MINKPNHITNDNGFIGTGTPYFYPDGGDAAFFFGNPVSCAIASSSEKKQRISNKKENPGAALDGKSRPNPAELTITTDTFQPRTWAMAMMGTINTVTTTPQTVADEEVTAHLDGAAQLALDNIDPDTFEVNDSTGSPLDKEAYWLNADIGLLQILDDTTVKEGDKLSVNYSTKEVTKTIIDGAKVSSFKGKIVIDGRNDVTDERAKLIIPNVTLSVDGSFDWFSDDYNTVTMVGTAAVGKDGSAPYSVELMD